MINWFLTKMQKQFNGERRVFLTHGAQKKKKEKEFWSISCNLYKNSKWMLDVIVRSEITILLKGNIWENLRSLFRQRFLSYDTKGLIHKITSW